MEWNQFVMTMAVIGLLLCALAHSVLIGRMWLELQRLKGQKAHPAKTPVTLEKPQT